MRKPSDETESSQPEEVKPKKKGKGKVIVILLVLCILLLGAYGAWHFFYSSPEDASDEKRDHHPAFTFPPLVFTVNLADTDQRRYLKATVELGYDSKGLRKELERKVPEIRDLIIEVFRARTALEINTTEGTNELRQDLKAQLNSRLQGGEIAEVYFTEFIIQ